MAVTQRKMQAAASGPPRFSAEEFAGDFGDVFALVARDFQLVSAGLAGAIGAGEGGGAVGRAAGDVTPCT